MLLPVFRALVFGLALYIGESASRTRTRRRLATAAGCSTKTARRARHGGCLDHRLRGQWPGAQKYGEGKDRPGTFFFDLRDGFATVVNGKYTRALYSNFFRFVPFPLARFNYAPASSCFRRVFSWRAEPLKRKAKGAAAAKPAAARGGGSRGGRVGGRSI